MIIRISTVVQTRWPSGWGVELLIQNRLRGWVRIPSLSNFSFNKAKFVERLLIKFSIEDFFISFQTSYQAGKKSTVVNLWSEVCIYGWIGNRIDWNQKRKRNDNSYFEGCTDRVAEWLRRWTTNPIRSPCVGWDHIYVVIFFQQSKICPVATYQVFCRRFPHQFPNTLSR